MRRIVALALASSLALSSAPLFAAQATASLAGTATSSSGQSVANATVHLRNLANGQIAGTTTSSTTGSFSFAGLQAGNYAVEVVNAAGQIIGTSASIGVAAGATVTGIAVSTSAVLAGAAAGGAAAGAADSSRLAGLRHRPFAWVSQATGIADSPIAASTRRMAG